MFKRLCDNSNHLDLSFRRKTESNLLSKVSGFPLSRERQTSGVFTQFLNVQVTTKHVFTSLLSIGSWILEILDNLSEIMAKNIEIPHSEVGIPPSELRFPSSELRC